MTFNKIWTTTMGLTILLLSFALRADTGIIKLSRNGICHDETSANYQSTKNFTAFNSLNDCLNHGRLPKVYQKKSDTAGGRNIPRYNRKEWEHWIDEDNDGLNTRHEILQKQSTALVHYNSKGTLVKRGKWFDPYSGQTFFSSSEIEIDHIVPLAYAHYRGGWAWNADKKRIFANDVSNLIPVQAKLNQDKGPQGPSQWLPPRREYRCQYLVRFDRIMKKYQLEYYASEKPVIIEMFNNCRSKKDI